MLPAQKYRQPEAGQLLAALHELSLRNGYLPQDELRRLAGELAIPLSQVYAAATFYAAFTFQPPGRRKVQVCEGTACYVRGARALMAALSAELGIEPGQTTVDRAFTLKSVRCVGSCGLAPIVRVGEETFGRLSPQDIPAILKRYRNIEPQVET